MKKFRLILFILGIASLIFGYFLNTSLYKIANSNVYKIADNNVTINRIFLKQEEIQLTDNITLLVFSNQLCIFYDEINGIPITDNIDINSIIGKVFYYQNIVNYPDLVYLDSIGVSSLGQIQLRQEPAVWLKFMTDNIESENISYTISSGFRDISLQEYIFNFKVNSIGEENAMKLAAKPGFSEHHLGTTIDIITYENNLKLLPTYTKTKLFKWLDKNAYKYGFVQSYPLGKTEETGFSYEPWHYRYVGTYLADIIHNSNITLYEYLSSQYNYCIVE